MTLIIFLMVWTLKQSMMNMSMIGIIHILRNRCLDIFIIFEHHVYLIIPDFIIVCFVSLISPYLSTNIIH